MVEHVLAKDETGVRFSLAALEYRRPTLAVGLLYLLMSVRIELGKEIGGTPVSISP